MNDCCASPAAAQSWIDWLHAAPMSPYEIISNALIGTTAASLVNSSNYNSATWSANTVVLKSNSTPQVAALETDNLLKVAEAAQWNFQHITANQAATLAPPLLKVFFMAVGTGRQNNFSLDFGGTTYTNLQLSHRDNAGTRGDAQGTIPVFQWTGSFTGVNNFGLTFKQPGRYFLGLRCDTGAAVSMYEFEVIVVA